MNVQEELDGVLRWIGLLLILLYTWLYPKVPWSHDSGHMICLLKFLYYLYHDPIMCLDVVDQIVQMCEKLFPSWGSHNKRNITCIGWSRWCMSRTSKPETTVVTSVFMVFMV